MKSVNDIFLRRKNKVCLPYTPNMEQQIPDNYLVAMLKNIAGLGYMFTERLIEQLKCLPVEFVENFYLETMTTLKEMKGVKTYEPMYPNFPKQVAEAHEIELFLNAIIHYWTLARPAYEKDERLPLFENTPVVAIGRGTEDEFLKIFKNVMSSNSSISATDRKDLAWLFENNLTFIAPWVPEVMPNKEVLAYTAGLVAKHDPKNKSGIMGRMFKTATDVLRLLTALSDGDVSLAENTKFRKFSRPERRMVMALLNQFPTQDRTENMQQYRERWLRVGEIVHPGEYQAIYPSAFNSFVVLRSTAKVETFNSKLEAHVQNKNYPKAMELLTKRPGIFARRLDEMFRTFPDNLELTLEHFGSIAHKVSTPVLVQLISHMKGRANTPDLRVFMPKGSVSKVQIHDNKFPNLPPGLTAQVLFTCEDALRKKFANLSEMGNVYLDRSLGDFTIPFGQRSASEALRVIPKGSRTALVDKDTIRMFIWWKDQPTSRVDIDLSSISYGSDWQDLGHISYTRLRDGKANFYHSGDLTRAPGPEGACEFIDIDIPDGLKAGIRYVLMNVYSYTHQPFNEVECLAGWMSRDSVNSGEIFDPKTVEHRFTLSASTKTAVPVLFDLIERKAIWLDLALTPRLRMGGNNVESNKTNLIRMAKATVERSYYNLGELFTQHVRARNGIFVDKPEDADIVLTSGDYTPTKEQRVVTPFDTEVILAEFLQ